MASRLRNTGRKSRRWVWGAGWAASGRRAVSAQPARAMDSGAPQAAMPKAHGQPSAVAASPDTRNDRLTPMPKLEV